MWGGCSHVWLLAQPPQAALWLLQAVQEQDHCTVPHCLILQPSLLLLAFHLLTIAFSLCGTSYCLSSLSKPFSFLILPGLTSPSPFLLIFSPLHLQSTSNHPSWLLFSWRLPWMCDRCPGSTGSSSSGLGPGSQLSSPSPASQLEPQAVWELVKPRCATALPCCPAARASPQEQGAAPGAGMGSPPGEGKVPLPPAIPHTTTSPWGPTASPYQYLASCCEEEGSFSFLGLPALLLTLCALLPSHPFPLTLVPGPLPSLRSISEVPC